MFVAGRDMINRRFEHFEVVFKLRSQPTGGIEDFRITEHLHKFSRHDESCGAANSNSCKHDAGGVAVLFEIVNGVESFFIPARQLDFKLNPAKDFYRPAMNYLLPAENRPPTFSQRKAKKSHAYNKSPPGGVGIGEKSSRVCGVHPVGVKRISDKGLPQNFVGRAHSGF